MRLSYERNCVCLFLQCATNTWWCACITAAISRHGSPLFAETFPVAAIVMLGSRIFRFLEPTARRPQSASCLLCFKIFPLIVVFSVVLTIFRMTAIKSTASGLAIWVMILAARLSVSIC